jgi:Ca2+-dependent lipid-binding protein
MSSFDKKATGKIYSIAVDITDLAQRVKDMQKVALDTSWLDELDVIDRLGYEARSKRTIDKITNIWCQM